MNDNFYLNLLEVVSQKDWIQNKDIRYIYGCQNVKASAIIKKIKEHADSQTKDISKTFIDNNVPTDFLLSYVGTSLPKLLKRAKEILEIQKIMQDIKKASDKSVAK